MKEEKIRKVAAYLRVSTFRQRDEETIKTQERHIQDYAVLKGINIDEWFPDDGVSSSKSWEKRPQGSQLIQKLRRGEIETLIVSRIDRLARSPRYVDDIIQACKKTKTKLLLIQGGFDIEEPMGIMMCSMIALFAQYEKEMIYERMSEGKRTKITNGKWLGRPPFGYIVNSQKELEIDEEKSQIIKQIFEIYLSRGSLRQVTDELNARGIPTPTNSSNGWMTSTIANILQHKVYYGQAESYKTDPYYNFEKTGKRDQKDIIVNEAPPIVDKNIWLRAQDRLEENKQFSGGKNKREYLLRGLIHCAKCGKIFIGHTINQKRRRKDGTMHVSAPISYYICNVTNANGTCKNGRVRADDLEAMIWEQIDNYLRNPADLIESLLERQREQFKEKTASVNDLDKVRNQIDRLTAQRQKLIDGYTKGIYTEKECTANLNDLRRQLDAAQTIHENLEKELDNSGEKEARKLNSARELLERLNDVLNSEIDFNTRREIINSLVESISVDVEIVENKRRANVNVIYRFQTSAELDGSTDSRIQSFKGGGRCWQHTGQPAILPPDKLLVSR